MDQVSIQNIELYNNFYNDTNASLPIFYLNHANRVLVRNIYAEHQSGSVFRLDSVLNQQFYNCSFKNATIPQDLTYDLQNIVLINRYKDLVYYNPTEQVVTTFNNFHVDVLKLFKLFEE